ncbi:hypothetical protein Back11_11520 [Paenibacillus baekrokdamisoli]|uniref:Uncharacterized protein n=1 Tax=Paenibacillus baekrokdamisoli TaxID=1712516 RepID=A0A3G9ILI4_9BACL|nr:hypothetical protein [Paenibacillus baekrokdamisoli]BBH19807.1 hypothetical protein Back11_11520 [Paenibacillus baekrokdamisoli]
MGIRPKVGSWVELKAWQCNIGEQAPPTPWKAEVLEIEPPFSHFPALYVIARKHDGRILKAFSSEFKGYASE